LTADELAGFRRQLESLRATLNGTVRSLAEDTLKPARAEDEDTDSFDQGLAISVAGSQGELLRDIDDALRRIDAGTYGVCEITERPIARVRLQALPYARYCIEAQAEQEHDRARNRPAE
jgi:RNA polymerase-binding transcription factor DksA